MTTFDNHLRSRIGEILTSQISLQSRFLVNLYYYDQQNNCHVVYELSAFNLEMGLITNPDNYKQDLKEASNNLVRYCNNIGHSDYPLVMSNHYFMTIPYSRDNFWDSISDKKPNKLNFISFLAWIRKFEHVDMNLYLIREQLEFALKEFVKKMEIKKIQNK